MAKVVKHCAACGEDFAEKFGFCPICGSSLTAYEMTPLAEKTSVGGNAANSGEAKTSLPVIAENTAPPVAERQIEPVVAVSAAKTFSTNGSEHHLSENGKTLADEPATAAFAAPPTVGSDYTQNLRSDGGEYKSNANGSSNNYEKAFATNQTKYDDGGYHITFVEEKNASSRNLLLLGSFLLVTTIALGGVIRSLYQTNAFIGSLAGDSEMLAYLGEEAPPPVEAEPPRKDPDKGGGGGGGGKENPEPVSKGRQPNQVDNPIMPPQPLPQVTNASLPNPNETQGKIKREKTDEPVGSLTGGLNPSSGDGRGGGTGDGRGTGFGRGEGTGEGTGIGSGSGNGRGNGTGNGTGGGDNAPALPPKPKPQPPPPAPKPVGVTQSVNITSKPRPSYTDAARQNQVTGVVRLRVTFLASGQIGSVSPVSGLPNGLTEQAISAAKQIRFEPAKSNGVPQTVTKQIEYSFSIY